MPFNVVRTSRIAGTDVIGDVQSVKDGDVVVEGAPPDARWVVRLSGPRAALVVDLGSVQGVRYLVVQAEGDDRYRIESSLDGVRYRELWTAGPGPDMGSSLRTRYVVLPAPIEARYLRVRGVGGDERYALAELAAYCSAPAPWPPRLIVPPRVLTWGWIDRDIMVQIKAWAAAFSTCVLLGSAAAVRRRKPILRITCDVLLGLCAVFALASWWNLGHFHFEDHIHKWELYHHYIGAKYAPELRYTRLYECTAAADLADGLHARVVQRRMRDLSGSNALVSTTEIVADPNRCTRHFSAERWQAFRDDVRSLRGQFAPGAWDQTQTDHGYNATPVWAILGRLVANTAEPNSATLDRIARIDSGLLVLMWMASLWAFGFRPTSVALLWWGYNAPASYAWTGGALLRFDWLCAMVFGICLLKRRCPFAAGVALTYSALLRIFPVFILASLLLQAVAEMIERRRIFVARSHALFAAGCIATAAILVPASGWATGGLDAWPQFFANSEKHLHTPLMNNMGLKTVLAYDPSTTAQVLQDPNAMEPLAEWKRARTYFQGKRQPLLVALIALFCVLLVRAARREPDWSVACLGVGLLALGAELTCYYYAFFLAYGLLWNRYMLPGITVTALAGVTCVFSLVTRWHDQQFAATSLATSLTVVAITAWIAFGPGPHSDT